MASLIFKTQTQVKYSHVEPKTTAFYAPHSQVIVHALSYEERDQIVSHFTNIGGTPFTKPSLFWKGVWLLSYENSNASKIVMRDYTRLSR